MIILKIEIIIITKLQKFLKRCFILNEIFLDFFIQIKISDKPKIIKT